MHEQRGIIKIEKFIDKSYINKNTLIALFFILLFLVISFIEKNLLLKNDGLGLLEHINIWIFLVINLIIPVIINKNFVVLEKNTSHTTFLKLKATFERTSKGKFINVLSLFLAVIGFCCFTGNSLQNAHIINKLPFDFWDSTNYIMSFIISRFYKLYLFSYFIPFTLTYVFVLVKATSEQLTISKQEMEMYPIKNYMQLNALCNFGIDTLLTLLIPIILFSSGVYWVHNRFDITSIITISIAVACTLSFLGMYMLLINNFYVSMIQYKKKHIELINLELAKIHQHIIKYQCDEKTSELLDVYLKKENYLWQSKERINKISKYPLVIKALFAGISPFIPALINIIVSTFKNLF